MKVNTLSPRSACSLLAISAILSACGGSDQAGIDGTATSLDGLTARRQFTDWFPHGRANGLVAQSSATTDTRTTSSTFDPLPAPVETATTTSTTVDATTTAVTSTTDSPLTDPAATSTTTTTDVASVGPSVDATGTLIPTSTATAPSSTSSTSPTSDLPLEIASDMGASDAPAHGIESWPQSRGGWSRTLNGLRQEYEQPSNFTSGASWGQIYRDYTDPQDTNTRIAIKDYIVYVFNNSTKNWELAQNGPIDGGHYDESYATNSSLTANRRTESDGSVSVKLPHGYNFHFWPGARIGYLDASTQRGVYAVFKARLIIDNPSGPDDRSTARYLMNVGGDFWASPSAPWAGFNVNNKEIAFSRFKYLTNDWQTIRFSSMLDSDLIQHPPPQ